MRAGFITVTGASLNALEGLHQSESLTRGCASEFAEVSTGQESDPKFGEAGFFTHMLGWTN